MLANLPLPPHYQPESVERIFRVPYEQRAAEAERWAAEFSLRPAVEDKFRVALIAVDVQNTFCLPEFELYVGGRSGRGAVDDNRRLVEFVYRNLGVITQIYPTLDTHQAAQIFHALFFVNERGEHPGPMTTVTVQDIENGVWRFNKDLGSQLGHRPGLCAGALASLHAHAGRDGTLCADRVALSRHAGIDRPCVGAGVRGGHVLSQCGAAQPAQLPGQG